MLDSIDEFDRPLPSGLSTSEAILQNYFIDRHTMPQIAKKYGMSKQYVSKLISKYRTILIKNIRKSVDQPSYVKRGGILDP